MNEPICREPEVTRPSPPNCGSPRRMTHCLASAILMLAATALGQDPGHFSVPTRPNNESAGPSVIDLRTAMALAELRAPDLLDPAAERKAVPAVRAAADRVVHRPPRAVMSVGPRRLSGGGQLGWDVTAGVFQEFSLGSYGRHLGSYASALEERANADFASTQRDARVLAGLAWVNARVAREILAIRREALSGTQETLRVAEARTQVGKSSPAEAALARALMGSVEASVLAALGDITVADAQLRYFCGIELHQQLELSGALDNEAHPIDEAAIRQRMFTQTPDLARVRATAKTLEQAAELGRAASSPHIELGPSVTHEGTGDWISLGNSACHCPGLTRSQRTMPTEEWKRKWPGHGSLLPSKPPCGMSKSPCMNESTR